MTARLPKRPPPCQPRTPPHTRTPPTPTPTHTHPLTHSSIARQFDAFLGGFKILCDGPAVRLFNACEVERLVCGNPQLDFDALQRNAKYEGGFSASTPAVQVRVPC